MLHQKIFVPYIILCTARLSLFHTVTLFSPLKYIVYRCYSCFRQRRGHLFHRHTCIQWMHSFSLYNAFVYTCHTFFCFIRKYLSHKFSYDSLSQSVSHWNSVFSFKIHYLQMLQLFQTKKGSFFNCHTFLALHQKIFVPYIILCIARLSLFHTVTLFSPLKYIVYKCYWCFRQRRGHFIRHTCIQWLHSFSLFNALYTLVTPFWCFIRKYLSHIFSYDSLSQSVSHWNSVFSFKIHCLQMLQLFQTKKGSSSHLYTVVA